MRGLRGAVVSTCMLASSLLLKDAHVQTCSTERSCTPSDVTRMSITAIPFGSETRRSRLG